MFNGKSFYEPGVNIKPRNCLECNKEFTPNSGAHRFCGNPCKRKVDHSAGPQYARISGDWRKYLTRLIQRKYRSELSIEFMLDLLERQEKRCALSGETMTCRLEKGTKFWTNASIDRIRAGEAYTRDNVRLVCTAVNTMRMQMTTEDFIYLCKEITKYGKKESIQ